MVVDVGGGSMVTAFCVDTLRFDDMELGDSTLGTGAVLDIGKFFGSQVVSGWVTRSAGDC